VVSVRRLAVLTVVTGALVAGCGDTDRATTTAPRTVDARRPPEAGAITAALAPLPGGGLRGGTLTTGEIRNVLVAGGTPATGDAARVLTRVAVSVGGQRGLLGLAVDGRGRTFAAFTARGGSEPLVVEQVLPGPHRRVWTGPPSTDLADGGHLEVTADGRLLIGVGDLQEPQRVPDDDAPHGKLLSLDPDGPATQKPRILSKGWNNPYAFATGPGGAVVVADNAPGRRPERIARGDAGGGAPRQVTKLRGRRAPSGLAVLDARTVAVCGVRSGRLERFVLRAGTWQTAGTIAPRCAFGVARLTDGRLALSDADGVRVVRP